MNRLQKLEVALSEIDVKFAAECIDFPIRFMHKTYDQGKSFGKRGLPG